LSQELRTVGLLRPHVLVGYQWSHTGLHSGRKTSHNRYIRSFVSQSPQNRTGTFQCIRLKHGTTPLRDTIGSSSTGPRHPLRDAVAPAGQPGRYYVSAGYRHGFPRWRGPHQRDQDNSADRSALPPTSVGCRFTTIHTRGKSARFRAGSCRNPYSTRYGPTFASSLVLYPQPHRFASRLAYPLGKTTGLPRCIPGTCVG